MRNHTRPPWGVARSSLLGRPLSANLGPDRAMPIPQRSSISRSQLLTRRTPTIWENHWNFEQASPTKQCFPNPPVRYDTDHLTCFLSGWGENTSVFRKLDETITRPLSLLHYYRLSNTPPMLAKEKSLHSQLERGSEIDSLVRHTQVGRKRCCSTNKAIMCSHKRPYVCAPQKWRRLEANHRSEILQFLRGATTLQDGGSLYVTKHYKLRVVRDKDRSQRHLPNHPYSSELPVSSSFSGNTTRNSAVPVSPLRTLHCTIRVFKSHKAHRTISSPIRHSPYYLSQRPNASSPIREPTTSRLVSSSLAVCCSEFHLKYPKECISTNPVSVIPGICDKHTENDHRLPSQKIHSIQKKATHLLSLDAVQVRTLAHFIGTLVATRPAVSTEPLYYRALQDLKIKTLHQSSFNQVMGQVTKEVQVDLLWWAIQLPTCYSSPIVKQEATILIESDASNSGWGAVCQGVKRGEGGHQWKHNTTSTR